MTSKLSARAHAARLSLIRQRHAVYLEQRALAEADAVAADIEEPVRSVLDAFDDAEDAGPDLCDEDELPDDQGIED